MCDKDKESKDEENYEVDMGTSTEDFDGEIVVEFNDRSVDFEEIDGFRVKGR